MEFKAFDEIKKLGKMLMDITQKIHGTNAHILVFQKEDGTLDLKVGSRTRWITPESDNFNFATFVYANKQEFIEKLGVGRHDGEWAGPGINSGEGLSEKTFILFNHRIWPAERPLPPRTRVVPVLYQGPIDLAVIKATMEDLKANGSKLAPGFMRPEGIVIGFGGKRYKEVFEPEETQWTKTSGVKNERAPKRDYNYLCQPIRLEKLLSRDDTYLKEYPTSLPQIVKAYVADLVKEEQIAGTEDEVKAITKDAAGQIFKFVKAVTDQAVSV